MSLLEEMVYLFKQPICKIFYKDSSAYQRQNHTENINRKVESKQVKKSPGAALLPDGRWNLTLINFASSTFIYRQPLANLVTVKKGLLGMSRIKRLHIPGRYEESLYLTR